MRTSRPVAGAPACALGLVAAALLVLTACGDEETTAPAPEGSTDTAATAGPAPSEEAGSDETPSEETGSDDAGEPVEAPTDGEEPSGAEAPSEGDAAEGGDTGGGDAREPLPPELEPFDQGETIAELDELRPGDCLDTLGDEATTALDCSEQHDGEVFYTFNLDEGEFPGVDALTETARPQCEAQIESYLGGPYEEGDTFLTLYHPTGTTWASGDTEIVCVLVHWDPQTTSAFGNGGITE